MKKLLGIIALVCVIYVGGCGSNAIGVSLTPSSAEAIDDGQGVNITAAVTNDSANKGVTWTLSGPGALANASGTSVTYNAPASGSGSATITATSVADATRTGSLTVTVTPPPAITTTSLPSGTEGTAYSQSIAATGGAATLTYSISAGSLPAGLSLSSAGAITGTPTGPNATANFTVKVTDSSAAGAQTATQALSITINLPPPPVISPAGSALPAGTVGTAYSQTLTVSGGLANYTWSVIGSLPAGLTTSTSANTKSFTISGTPSGPIGTANFQIKVTDTSNPVQNDTQSYSIKINPAPVVITTTALVNGVVNAAYTATLQSTGGAAPITWSVTVGALPAGLALNASTGAITGTPTTAGTVNFTVQAADSSSPQLTDTKALSITVIPVLSITTTSLVNGITGTAYSATLASTGGVTPETWSVTVGTLPAGLSLNASTGAITGTPTTAGTSNFTIQAADSGTPQQTVTKALSITIIQALSITTTSPLAVGAVNSAYNQTVQSTGGVAPITWSVSVGSLPAGLSLNAGTGAITGTATTAGTFNFTVQAVDSGTPQQTVTKALSITINPPLSVSTASLPNGTVATPYNQTLQSSGGISPVTWSITVGTLPSGLTLNASTGAISGTPTTQGTSNFTVQAADSSTPQQTATKALSISITLGPLVVTPATLPTGAVNEAYPSTNLAATGGLPPYTWSVTVGALPAGLALNASTGAITGTPTTSGTFSFTAEVKDSTNATATGNFSITVNPVLTVTTSSLPSGTQGTSYTSTNLNASGGVTPYTWSITVGSLPTGMTLSGNTISGTPTASGTFPITVQVTDAASGTATANLSIVINPAPPLTVTTTSGSLPAGTLNTAYPSTNLSASGGIQPYTWSITVGALPTGLALNTSTGAISGTPTVSGTFNFTAKVTDSVSATATAVLSITVNAAPCAGYGSGNESVLNGQYAFMFQGFLGNGATSPFAAAASFAADGTGKITAGDTDINQASGGPQHLTISATGSTYTIGSDDRGCAVISFGASNSVVLHFAVGGISAGVASKGRIIEFDDTDGTGTRGAGILRLQTKTDFLSSKLKARYAFGVDGFDSTSGHVAIGGAFATGGSGTTITNGYTDVDDAGALQSGLTGAAGTIGTISSSTGRATVTYNAGASANYNWVIYVVNANEVFIVSSDTLAANKPITSGRAIVTGSAFSSASLNGHYIIHLSGVSGGNSQATLGLLNITGGTLNGTLWEYSLSSTPNAKTNAISGGTYTVNATSGRVTLASVGTNPPVLYLTTPTDGISAFIIGSDNSAIFGPAELQPAATYSTNSLSGNGGKFFFGTEDPSDNTVTDEVGTVTVTGSTGAISGLGDSSGSSSPFLHTANTVSGTIVINSDGTGNVGSGSVAVTNGTKLFFIDEGGGPAKITVVEQ